MKRSKEPGRWLALDRLVCKACPYFANGKCEGETDATNESFYMNDESVGGCLETKRQIELFSNIQSLRPPKQTANHSSLILPELIFGIKDGLKGFPSFTENNYFAISFSTLIDEKGCFKFKSSARLRNALRIPNDVPLAFVGTALDSRLEPFWHKSIIKDLWKRIADFDFSFATSLSFSVYDKHPRFDQIFNRERNFITHDLLLAKGVNSIPFIFFYNYKDFRESVNWINDRPDISVIAIHAQQHKSSPQVLKLVSDMKSLEREVQRKLHFVVVGVSARQKFITLKKAFSNLSVITHHPLSLARQGYKILPNLSSLKMPKSFANTLLADPNINTYKKFYSSI